MKDEKSMEMQKVFGNRKWIVLQYVGVFLFFFAAALVFGRFSLSSPYIGDDLHLIRVYSTDELKGVWVGTWDPDRIETPGFRPFTTYFDHFLALAFGSSAIGQRAFLLGLFAMLLTLVGIVARSLFGTSYRMILLGGLLGLLHMANVPHYSWIADGVHLAMGLFVFGAIGFALKFVYGGGGQAWWLLASGLCVIGALLVREDALVVYPLLVLFVGAAFFARRVSSRRTWPGLLLYGLSLSAVLLAWWYWRRWAVPEAVSPGLSWRGWLWSVEQSALLVGDATRLVLYWNRWLSVIELWKLCLGALGVIGLFLVDRKTQMEAGFWLLTVWIAALPGLTLARINLLLLPTIFFSFAVATVLLSFSRCSVFAYLCAIAIAFFALGAAASGSYLLQRERVPANIDYLCGSPEWLYGKFAHATIPTERREEVKRHLEAVGIYSLADRDRVIPLLIADAKKHGRYAPKMDGSPFIPKFRFLISPAWRLWSCVGREGWIFQ
jgi:hypothetical protein